MEPQQTKPKKREEEKNNGNLIALAIAGGVFYYFFTRANIIVCDIDEVTRSVFYKVKLGFKNVEGEITAYNPNPQRHKFFNRELIIETNSTDTVTFTIENDKGEIIDQFIQYFEGGTGTNTEPQKPYSSCQN